MAEDPSPPPAAAAGSARRGRSRVQTADLAVARRRRRRRLELGLTQQEAAERVGVIGQQLHKYEAGLNRLSVGRLHRIAQALGVEIDYFFADVDREGPGAAEPPEDTRTRQRRLTGLVRHAASIRDPGHREALCQLARELAALGTGLGEERHAGEEPHGEAEHTA